MALCLAIAVSSHYFGVFLLWPLLVGEAVRYRQSRRFSRALLVAMSVGIAPLIFFLPLLRDAKRYASGFWAQPEIVKDSQMFLAQFLELFWIVALVNICGILVVMLRSSSWRMRREKIESRITPIKVAMTIPIHEIAAIVALALLPIVCVTAALLAHSGYVFRYAVAGVVGACLLLGIVAAWVEKRLPATRWMFLTACLLCVFINQVTQSVWRREGEDRVLERSARLQQTVRKSVPPEFPIVVGSSRRFLELSHYAPPDLRRRLVYLPNVSLSRRYLKNDTGDLAMLKLARYAPISVRDYRNFFNNNRRFILLDSGGGDQWIVPHLRASGVVWKLSVKAEGEQFYIVDLGANYSR